MKKIKQDLKMTTLLLSKDMWLAAKRRALAEDKSLRAVIREALAAHLGRKAVAR